MIIDFGETLINMDNVAAVKKSDSYISFKFVGGEEMHFHREKDAVELYDMIKNSFTNIFDVPKKTISKK